MTCPRCPKMFILLSTYRIANVRYNMTNTWGARLGHAELGRWFLPEWWSTSVGLSNLDFRAPTVFSDENPGRSQNFGRPIKQVRLEDFRGFRLWVLRCRNFGETPTALQYLGRGGTFNHLFFSWLSKCLGNRPMFTEVNRGTFVKACEEITVHSMHYCRFQVLDIRVINAGMLQATFQHIFAYEIVNCFSYVFNYNYGASSSFKFYSQINQQGWKCTSF